VSPSPSHWESSSESSSSSLSSSASPSPSNEVPVEPDDKLRMIRDVIFSEWSWWFLSPNYWGTKLQKVKDILNG
jgi:hypothetical protein